MAPGQPRELGSPRHPAVGREDLAEHARGLHPGEPRQVERGLGVPRPAQDAASRRAERENVPGPRQLLGTRARRRQRADRRGPVVRRGTGRRALEEVDGHREGRGEARRVQRGHEREAQLFETLRRHRDAEEAARVARHEVHVGGRAALRRHDEVPFVLAVLVVHDDHHPPGPDRAQRGLDRMDAVRAVQGSPLGLGHPALLGFVLIAPAPRPRAGAPGSGRSGRLPGSPAFPSRNRRRSCAPACTG